MGKLIHIHDFISKVKTQFINLARIFDRLIDRRRRDKLIELKYMQILNSGVLMAIHLFKNYILIQFELLNIVRSVQINTNVQLTMTIELKHMYYYLTMVKV